MFPPPPPTYATPTYEQQVNAPARYRSPALLATWVIVSLVVGIGADIGSIVSSAVQRTQLSQVDGGASMRPETAAMYIAPLLFALAQLMSYATTTILFLFWMARCYSNLEAISRWRLQFGSGWAIGSWFVPFLNLVRPYQIVRETLWVSSYPELADDVGAGYAPPGTPLLACWWAGWLIYVCLSAIGFRLVLAADTPGELLTVGYFGAISDGLAVVTAILAASLVRTISSRQQDAVGARGLDTAPSGLTVA